MPKLGIGANLALLLGIIGLVIFTIVSPDTRVRRYPKPPPPGPDDRPLVQRRVDDRITILHVDWDLPSAAQREQVYGFLTVRVQLTDASGDAADADVVLLQGRHFAGRLQLGRSGDPQVTFLSGAPLRAFASSPHGGAELSCYVVHGDPDDSFLCTGKLSAAVRVEFPAEPPCPPSPAGPVLANAFPEVCFGLTALELTRLHQEIDYQPRRRDDHFMVMDGHNSIWELAPGLGERADAIHLSSHELLREPGLIRALEAALGPARPLPAAERFDRAYRHKNLLSSDKQVFRVFGDDTRPFQARLEEDFHDGVLDRFELTLFDGG